MGMCQCIPSEHAFGVVYIEVGGILWIIKS